MTKGVELCGERSNKPGEPASRTGADRTGRKGRSERAEGERSSMDVYGPEFTKERDQV